MADLERILRLPDLIAADDWLQRQGGVLATRRADAWRFWQAAVQAPGERSLAWMDLRSEQAGFPLQVDEAHLLLQMALENGQLLAAEWLYMRGAPLENPREGACLEIELELIHAAAMGGHPGAIHWVKAHGGQIEPPGDTPMPPLRMAVTANHVRAFGAVQALLDAGANAARVGPEHNPGNVLENLMDSVFIFHGRGRDGIESFRKLWDLLVNAGANPRVLGRSGQTAEDRLLISPQADWYTKRQEEERARQREERKRALEAASITGGVPERTYHLGTSPTLQRMRRHRPR